MLQRTTTRAKLYRSVPISPVEAFEAYYKTGAIAKQGIDSLLDSMVGKEYDAYSTPSHAGRLVIDALANSSLGIDRSDLSYERESPSNCVVRYKGQFLCDVTVSKKKGQLHWICFGSRYDWEVKATSVCWKDPDDSLELTLEKLREQAQASIDRKEQEEQRLAKLAASIMSLDPSKKAYDWHKDLETIAKKIWLNDSFTKRVEGIMKG